MAYPQPPPGLYGPNEPIPDYGNLPRPKEYFMTHVPTGDDYPGATRARNLRELHFPMVDGCYRTYTSGTHKLKIAWYVWNTKMRAASIQERANEEQMVVNYWSKCKVFGPTGTKPADCCFVMLVAHFVFC